MSINPILAALGQQTKNPSSQHMNNPLAIIAEFANFKKAFADKDPEAVLNQLLSSGKMSKEQFNSLKAEAETLLQFLK